MLAIQKNPLAFVLAAALLFAGCVKHSSPQPTPPTPPSPPAPPSLAITGFSPTHGPDSTQVTFTGTAFSTTATDDSIYFNGAPGKIGSATDSTLVVIIPELAGTGNPTGVGVGPNGTVYAMNYSISAYDNAAGAMTAISRTFGVSTYSTLRYDAVILPSPNLVFPCGIVRERHANLYVVQQADAPGSSIGSVIKMTP